MKTIEELNKIIDVAHGWRPKYADTSCGVFELFTLTGQPICDITFDDLNKIDNRLLVVIRDLMTKADHSKEYVHGSWARGSLDLWSYGSNEVMDWQGNMRNMFNTYWARTEKLYDSTTLVIRIQRALISSCTYMVDGELTKLEYCQKSYKENMQTNLKWMDETYPGWRARLLTLEALGESEQYVADNLFVKPIKNISLPATDISFSGTP